MWRSVSLSSSPSIHSIARLTDMAVNSWIAIPPSSTARDSGLRREPLQAGQRRPRLGPQTRAVAGRARHQRHVLLDALADVLGVGLAVAALEPVDDPLETRRVGALAPVAVAIADVDPLAVCAVEEQVLLVV